MQSAEDVIRNYQPEQTVVSPSLRMMRKLAGYIHHPVECGLAIEWLIERTQRSYSVDLQISSQVR